jgi:serine/threonine protein kinase
VSKFCCFCCPTADYSIKLLTDRCPSCNQMYGFPLFDPPSVVANYTIVKSLGRGFYASTYVAERGPLKTKVVLKISPKAFFHFFPGKDFEKECQTHATVAEGTEHIVGIRDMLDADVAFGTTVVPCHIAELEYVNGELLAEYLKPTTNLSATTAAQIAVDFFKLRDELQKKAVNHNDLHAENIIVAALGPDARRAGAIDDSIRAVAIDLGSISDGSKSDSAKQRLGDLHWIAEHLHGLIGKLLRDPDKISDLDNRLASALQLITQSISPSAENQRTPASADLIGQLEEAYYRVTQHWRPWREPLSLRAFNASYNAQTMQAWHVPQLLVTPRGNG